MPTYRNDSTTVYTVDNKSFSPGEVIQTYKILNLPGVTKLSDEPILPLALSETELQATTAGEELYVDVDLENCNKIEITSVTAKIEVRANVPSSSNPFARTVEPGEVVTIYHDNEIEKLYIRFPISSGFCRVIQMREK